MRFKRLTTDRSAMYAQAMALYHISFPFYEQREDDSQARIMSHEDYHFNLIEDEDGLIGLMLCWETPRFIYVEHFCILPSRRNKGYGTKALATLGREGKAVILEIDPPADEISIRRKAFYERDGFHVNNYVHDHPAYHAGYSAHRLLVMSSPEPLEEELYAAFARYLDTVVMKA